MKQLLEPGSIVVVIGPGGVGKTTVAATLGMAGALAGLATAVITVDPARRLRDALGLASISARPARLDRRRLRSAGLDPELSLTVMGLDVKATWNGLFERCIADPAARKLVFANSFYRNLTERFVGAESYAALELLRELHERGDFTLEIADTPPAMQAFDFIEAPDHLARLLNSSAARWVLQRAAADRRLGLGLGSRAARLVIEQLERVAGANPLFAIAEFLSATAGASDAIRERMSTTAALLRSPAVSFVLVTTAAEDRLREAAAIARNIEEAGIRLRMVVINRVTDEATFNARRAAPKRTAALRRELAALCTARGTDRRINASHAAIVAYLEDYLTEQAAALDRVARFSRELSTHTAVAALPEIAGAANELDGIVRLAAILTTATRQSPSRQAGARSIAREHPARRTKPQPG